MMHKSNHMKDVKACLALLILFAVSCNGKGPEADASGVFEADEVIVSAEVGGKILEFGVREGDTVSMGKLVAVLDATNLSLQKEQVVASIAALKEKTNTVEPQILLLEEQERVQQSQLATLKKERARFEKLVRADAATPKQLDDIIAQIDVLERQIAVTRQQKAVQRNLVGTQNRSVLSESSSLEKRAAQIQDQLQRGMVQSPLNGTVLTTYVHQGELATPGKPLFKIADLSTLTLRAYISGEQLPLVKIGQAVQVRVDAGAADYKNYAGTISWVSDKAEFTPKTIQTKEERANLVYATKILVKNDGYLKIGMYGEVIFNPSK
jgi:HlyD family secretion protein